MNFCCSAAAVSSGVYTKLSFMSCLTYNEWHETNNFIALTARYVDTLRNSFSISDLFLSWAFHLIHYGLSCKAKSWILQKLDMLW